MAYKTQLTEREKNILEQDCIQALRNLTESNSYSGKLIKGLRYFRPCMIAAEAMRIREERGLDSERATVRKNVSKALELYFTKGEIVIEHGKVERLYRTVQRSK